ncbi:unnamed protein product [Pedinophyceae sp. YPF-701]|nr:unnamed protein product [Pedinophyceae sp. YPF-701]
MGTDRGTSAALLTRVLSEVSGGVLDRLSNGDKKRLAAARWSTLEAVLRGSDATLKVHPEKPVLHVLARVLDGGECRGQIMYRGVRVPATDAGAFIAAVRGAEQGHGRAANEGRDESVASWAAFVWRVLRAASTSEEGPVRVTALDASYNGVMATDGPECVALALRTVLEHSAVQEHLRLLVLHAMRAGAVDMLRGSLCGLTALRVLQVRGSSVPDVGDGAALVGLIQECPSLRRLTLVSARIEAKAAEALLRWASGASELRRLRLACCVIEPEGAGELWASEAHPLRRLETYEAMHVRRVSWATLRAWQGLTHLRRLVLHSCGIEDADVARALAELLRTSEALKDVDLTAGVSSDPNGGLATVLAALAQNTSVRRFEMRIRVGKEFSGSSLAQEMAAVVRDNGTLKDFKVYVGGGQRLPCDDDDSNVFDIYADAGPVAEALMANTSLETLCLPAVGPDGDAAAIGERMARNQTLRHLEFGRVRFADGDLEALGRGLARMVNLQTLMIRAPPSSQLDFHDDRSPCVAPLIDGLWGSAHKSQLRWLHLFFCKEQADRTAARLARVLASQHCMLRKLDLTWVGVGDRDALELARALHTNTTLVSLDMQCDTLNERGLVALLHALRRNNTLRELNLQKCGVREYPTNTLEEIPAIQEELQPVRGRVLL